MSIPLLQMQLEPLELQATSLRRWANDCSINKVTIWIRCSWKLEKQTSDNSKETQKLSREQRPKKLTYLKYKEQCTAVLAVHYHPSNWEPHMSKTILKIQPRIISTRLHYKRWVRIYQRKDLIHNKRRFSDALERGNPRLNSGRMCNHNPHITFMAPRVTTFRPHITGLYGARMYTPSCFVPNHSAPSSCFRRDKALGLVHLLYKNNREQEPNAFVLVISLNMQSFCSFCRYLLWPVSQCSKQVCYDLLFGHFCQSVPQNVKR